MNRTLADSILIVDDAAKVAGLLVKILAGLPYRTLTARSVQGAVQALREIGRIRVLIVDLVLPDGTGLDVVRAARGLNPEVPVLLLSGYGVELPGVEFLRKPFDPAELLRRVEAMVE
jgi:two-component system OmpR family response regulator